MVMCGFKLVITLVLMRFSAVFPGGGGGGRLCFPKSGVPLPRRNEFLLLRHEKVR